MSDYSVLNALRAWKKQRKDSGKNPNSLKTVGPEILPAYTAVQAIQPFCLHLRSFASGTSVLPDDFDTVPRSSAGLKAHTRPDGACYLGAFEFANDPPEIGAIVVYGDPLMSLTDGHEIARRFRAVLVQQMDTFDQAKALGPFAGTPQLDH